MKKAKVSLIKPSKFLDFDSSKSKTICYEREGLVFNSEAFDLSGFQKSYDHVFEEVQKFLSDP